MLPYSIQFASDGRTIALAITDPAQRNMPNSNGHRLDQGTYVVQASYDGPSACRIMSAGGALSGWVERGRIPSASSGVARSAVVVISVPFGESYEVRLWADQEVGYSGALTVTRMPDFEK